MGTLIRLAMAFAALFAACGLVFAQEAPLRPGDSLLIACESDPTFSGRFTLTSEGWLIFPVLGAVSAVGRTASDLRALIVERLDFAGWHVGVGLEVVRSAASEMGITYSGSVASTGSLPPNRVWRLSDVVRLSKPTEAADLERVAVIDATGVTHRFSLEAVTPGSDADRRLRPGDSVFFPVSTIPDLVSVLGAVQSPGTVPFRAGMTVRDAIQGAGGLTANGDGKTVRLERKQAVIDTINLELSYNASVKRGDVVRVSAVENPEFVVVSGAALKPGKLPFLKGMSLMQAIAAAGGPSPMAKRDTVALIRRVGGKQQRQEFSLAKLRSGAIPDPNLEPGDVVEFPFRRQTGVGL